MDDVLKAYNISGSVGCCVNADQARTGQPPTKGLGAVDWPRPLSEVGRVLWRHSRMGPFRSGTSRRSCSGLEMQMFLQNRPLCGTVRYAVEKRTRSVPLFQRAI